MKKENKKKWVKPQVKAIVIKSAAGPSSDGLAYTSGT